MVAKQEEMKMKQEEMMADDYGPQPGVEALARVEAVERDVEGIGVEIADLVRLGRAEDTDQAPPPPLVEPALPFHVVTVKPNDHEAEIELWDKLGKLQIPGHVTKDDKGQRGRYASLAQVLELAKPIFKDAGLGFFHVTAVATGRIVTHTVPSKDRDKLVEEHHDARSFMQDVDVTLVVFTSKARLVTTMRGTAIFRPANSMEQGVGIVTTYFRRYGLKSLLGLAEVDTDGNHGPAALAPLKTENMGPSAPPEGEA